ncbi:TPA: hypothetical protein ACGU7D_000802 [Vibrio vulnificus]
MIVDKCYIQGAKTDLVRQLCDSTQVYLCEAFLYEVFKQDKSSRAKMMRKFPDPSLSKNSYKSLPSVYKLLAFELENKSPFGNVDKFLTENDYSIHTQLTDETFDFGGELSKSIDNRKDVVNNGTASLFKHIKDFTPIYNLLKENSKGNLNENIIGENAVRIIMAVMKVQYDNEVKGTGKKTFPNINNIDSTWFVYRFVQVHNLVAINILSRYPDLKVLLDSDKAKEKLRHDYLDIEYLLWGIILNGISTYEKKLNDWYELLTNAQ